MKINDVVFDSENKEYVKITNGITVGTTLVPTEAIAFRFLGFDDQDKPILAVTYRKVNSEKLSMPVSEVGLQNESFKKLISYSNKNTPHWQFVGRI